MKLFKLIIKVLLPLLVLTASASVAFHTVANRPEPERRGHSVAVPRVEIVTLERGDYTVVIRTRGTVAPRTEGTLISEIAGRIVEVSPTFRAGGFFEAGDVLLKVDPRDYQAEVVVAQSDHTQARMAVVEEQARADQAARDWKRLGESGEPDDLVLRKPQLASARAAVRRAEARLDQARLDVERSKIVAPYAGRVLEQHADIGQYVSRGTVLARIYAVDYVEVRLPLSNRQLEYVAVPEIYRSDQASERTSGPAVRLSARIGRQEYAWEGRLIRAEGTIDTQSRQLFVIAQVDDPYGKGEGDRPPLKVGQFVKAEIQGAVLKDVFVIARGALRAGDEVFLINQDSRLESRAVQVLWSDQEHAVVGAGLHDGERLVRTALALGMNGVEVRVAGDPDPSKQHGGARTGQLPAESPGEHDGGAAPS